MLENDFEEFINSGDIVEVEKTLNRFANILSDRKRNIEMQKRLSHNPVTTCKDCEYGRFHPCNYFHWGFETKRDDPSCEAFTKWGVVW